MPQSTTVSQGSLTEINYCVEGEEATQKLTVTMRHAVTGLIKKFNVLMGDNADLEEELRHNYSIWTEWRFVKAEVIWTYCF